MCIVTKRSLPMRYRPTGLSSYIFKTKSLLVTFMIFLKFSKHFVRLTVHAWMLICLTDQTEPMGSLIRAWPLQFYFCSHCFLRIPLHAKHIEICYKNHQTTTCAIQKKLGVETGRCSM